MEFNALLTEELRMSLELEKCSMLVFLMARDSTPMITTQELLMAVSLTKLLVAMQLKNKVEVSVQSMAQATLLEIMMTVVLSFMLVISA
jgi:hypothetical protein